MRWKWWLIWVAAIAGVSLAYEHLDVKRMLGCVLVLVTFLAVKTLEAEDKSQ